MSDGAGTITKTMPDHLAGFFYPMADCLAGFLGGGDGVYFSVVITGLGGVRGDAQHGDCNSNKHGGDTVAR